MQRESTCKGVREGKEGSDGWREGKEGNEGGGRWRDNYRYNQVYRPEACIGFSDIPPTNNVQCTYSVLYKMYLMPSMYLLSIQYTIHTLYFHPRTLT